jgi:hypothetical protein
MIEIVRATEDHVADIGTLWLEFMHFHQDINPIFEPREGSVPGFGYSFWKKQGFTDYRHRLYQPI